MFLNLQLWLKTKKTNTPTLWPKSEVRSRCLFSNVHSNVSDKSISNTISSFYTKELQRKVRLLTEMSSRFVEAYERKLWIELQQKKNWWFLLEFQFWFKCCVSFLSEVKIDFDRKIAELNRTKDVQAALGEWRWSTQCSKVPPAHILFPLLWTCSYLFLLFSGPVLKLINVYDELRALKEQIALSEDQDLTSGEGQKSQSEYRISVFYSA